MNFKIKSIIVEDQPLAQEKLVGYIEKIDYIDNIGVFDNCFEALNFIKNKEVDLIFLDIQMDDFNGIQFLESLVKKPFVILTTAYDSYALKGYELDVSDYLLKPISFSRFLKSVEKIYSKFVVQEPVKEKVIYTQATERDFIFVRSDYKMKKIYLKDILYVEGMKDYLSIYTTEKRIFTLMSFKQIENILPESQFLRIHKSYIISIDHLESYDKSTVTVATKHIPIGETYKQQFYKFIEGKQS